MSTLYIVFRKDRISVRHLESGKEKSGRAAFSGARIIVGQFFVAEKLLVDLIGQLDFQTWPKRLFARRRVDIVADVLEMNEGGLSQVEERAVMEVIVGATKNGFRRLIVHSGTRLRADSEIHSLLNAGRS